MCLKVEVRESGRNRPGVEQRSRTGSEEGEEGEDMGEGVIETLGKGERPGGGGTKGEGTGPP